MKRRGNRSFAVNPANNAQEGGGGTELRQGLRDENRYSESSSFLFFVLMKRQSFNFHIHHIQIYCPMIGNLFHLHVSTRLHIININKIQMGTE